MPFFDNNDWFSEASRVWLWVVLTLPATVACFLFYKVAGSRVKTTYIDDNGNETIEL